MKARLLDVATGRKPQTGIETRSSRPAAGRSARSPRQRGSGGAPRLARPASGTPQRARPHPHRHGLDIAGRPATESIGLQVTPRDVVPVVDFGLRAPFDERFRAVAVVGDSCLAAIELLVVEGEVARGSWLNRFEITVQSVRDHVRRLPLVLTIPARITERPEFGTKRFSRDGVRNRPISRTG